MSLPSTATLVEVSPRDGLQNERKIIPTSIKLQLINMLAEAGLSVIEATSFVSPKWVPQLADHAELLAQLQPKPGVRYPVLVPNQQGLKHALDVGAKAIAVFAAASETFSRKNINTSIADSLTRYETIIAEAKQHGCWIRGYVSCIAGCPYEGKIQPTAVTHVAQKLFELGCDEISLGDTIGVGTPSQITEVIDAVAKCVPLEKLALHCHDTYGHALENIQTALRLGIHTFDAAVTGLGGCPYAKGATGNVATEKVLALLTNLNIQTGVDRQNLLKAGKFIRNYLV